MSEKHGLTFYSYSSATRTDVDRWRDTGIANEFFHDEAAARLAVVELFAELRRDPEATLTPMYIEKIETLPLTKQNVLALLNFGVGPFVDKYYIMETICVPK